MLSKHTNHDNKMRKSATKFIFVHCREIILITIISVLVFTFAILFSSKLLALLNFTSIQKKVAVVEESLQQELNYILKQREEIISEKILDKAFINSDLSQLTAASDNEAKKRNLDSVSLTDKYGFIIHRTSLPSQIGDNIFQTTIHGREINKGKTVNAIINGARIPLALISASFVYSDGQDGPIGSVIAGRTINNPYAIYFKEKYLQPDEQVAFYTSKGARNIVGDSFRDEEKTRLINDYFLLGYNFTLRNFTGFLKEIKIGDNYYFVRNVVFSGIGTEKSPGGVFIFYPISHVFYGSFFAGGVALLFLIPLFLFFFFKRADRRKRCMPLYVVMLLGLVLFIALYFVIIIKLGYSAVELKKSPFLIYNSTLAFSPESDVINQFSEKTIAIQVSTGGEAINAITAIVNYDPEAVRVIDIITANSFCDPSFFIEKNIDNQNGEVRISCIKPNPGFSGYIGTVAELLVKPLVTDKFFLIFNKETEVLANDGLGTDVLRTMADGYYQVVPQKFDVVNIQDQLRIFSLSHPNNNRWYSKKEIALLWSGILNGVYYYSLNRHINPSAEDKISSTTSHFLNTSLDNGINYFHLQTKNLKGQIGPFSNYKIMIDTIPPLPPEIKASATTVQKGEVVRFNFTSSDTLSGLQSGFYVKINDGIFLPVKSPFYAPFFETGSYHIVIRVFDNADNFNDSSVVIRVVD